MKVSNHGLNLLEQWEDNVLHLYKDSAGLPTIGIGHLLTKSERASGLITIKGVQVAAHDGITEQQSLDLLAQDLYPVECVVNSSVKVALNQNQFDALTIFAFNIGNSGFMTSSALSTLNSGNYDGVPARMAVWNKITKDGQHVVCDGLVTRRANEIKLYNGEL
jgi:lysozyme